MHLHLDLVGGIAGDVFAGALLDLRPELSRGVVAAIRDAGLNRAVGIDVLLFMDGILSGHKFDVQLPAPPAHHRHVHWSTLKDSQRSSRLDENTCDRAISIFELLAEAEVYGQPVRDVTFHVVGAWTNDE